MWTKATASQVLREFAEGRRRVISEWRILIVARRIAQAANAPLPDESKARDIRWELERRGMISPAKGVEGVYIIDVPYANLLEVSEEQIIQEANPWAVFGFLTAMVHHGLTDLLPKDIYAIQFKDGEHLNRIPLGTMPDDWADDMRRPPEKRPTKVNDVKVIWTGINGDREFGVTVGYSSGLPIYLTDVERTLIDAIRMPEKCGGIAKVLHAWRSAENIDLDRLVEYTDRYDIQNVRQRVGFLLEALGRTHPKLAEWRHRLQRGGSVKLVANGAYSGTYSAEWNLSLNVPPSVLAVIE
jgi:predicted transcriptional regulator of viral defense system